MFRDLRERVSAQRRALAWALLALLVAAAAWSLPMLVHEPWVRQAARLVFWAAVAFAAVRALTFLLVDPLMRQEQNGTPGFARDMLVLLLYVLALGGLLRNVVGVGLAQLLGTGALAAAVIGLSMQETLGNVFAGLSLSLDNAFQVGDWIEITGSWRGGVQRESQVGRVEAMTWRAVQLVTWDGDTDLVPNRILAQSLVTNLYAPAGLHRRTAHYTIQPTARLHEALALLDIALAGIPHLPEKRPKAVAWGQQEGGVVIELQWWTLGFRHGKASADEVNRLAPTVLTREGFPLMGPSGPSTPAFPRPEAGEALILDFLRGLHLPEHWAPELKSKVRLRDYAPGEGILREGDPGDSLFGIVAGRVSVVRAVQRNLPHHGLYWEEIAELGPGRCVGEASLLTGAPRNATVIAREACTLMELDKAGFEATVRREPQVLERLARLLEEQAPQALRPAEDPIGRLELWGRQIRAWFGIM